jgi:DNA repair protein RadD
MKGNRWRGGPGRPPAPGICVSNDSLGDITPTSARQGLGGASLQGAAAEAPPSGCSRRAGGRAMSSVAPALRDYQIEVITKFDAEVAAGRRRVLLVAPTASGKTVVAGAIIGNAASTGRRILFLAHRRELIQQASRKLHAVGVDHGIIQAGFSPRPSVPVQVASVQTLHARAIRGTTMELPSAAVVVVDEAHHIRARTYQRLLSAYPEAIVLGLTATPCRGDGRGLGNAFDVLVECPPVAELIAAGFLVPTRVYAPSLPDLKGVRVERGDYVEKQLAERMDRGQLVGDIVTHWLRLAERRRTVIFATGVNHSVHLREEFRRADVVAEHIDGTTPIAERDAILARLAAGTVEVVVNAMVLCEGWDCPEISCLVLARPTKHMGLYRQMVGRVLRPSPGKVDALILDHASAVFAHGFVEEPVVWTLAQDKRAENPIQTSRAMGRAPSLTTCPECSAVRLSGRPCTACGWRPRPKPEALDVIDGELGHVDRERRVEASAMSAAQMLNFYGQLLWIAKERDYKRGWAAHKFKEKFGMWPPNQDVTPVPPEPTTQSWVRSRAIAYAKTLERRSA